MSSSRSRTLVIGAALVAAGACASSGSNPAASASAPSNSQQLEPVETRLQRMAPGAVVTRTASGITVTMRGTSSSYNGQTSTPLYVVNGVKMQPGPGGLLTGIDPDDITRIRVLRSAESGMYGIEGSNGVIEITTKRAAGRP